MINKQPQGFKPGIYFDLPAQQYHDDPAIGSSNIKDLLISPLKYWTNSSLNPDRKSKETSAKTIGTALHCYLMERERFHQDYIILPKLDIDSDLYRQESKKPDFLQNFALHKTKDAKTFKYIGSKIELKESEFAEIKEAVEYLEKQEAAGSLFSNGYREVSVFWRDRETGLMCKCRPDYLAPKYIADYKSINDIEKIGKSMADYKYYIQAAFYLEGLSQIRKIQNGPLLDIEHNNFIFAFQEKESPYLVRLKAFDEEVLNIGRDKFRLGLQIYKENIEKYGVKKWEDDYRRNDEQAIQIMGLFNLPTYIQYQ